MKYLIRHLILSLIVLSSSASLMADQKIKVAFGNALAPWVMPDKHKGIIIEIIEAAMNPLGYEIEKVYLPYARRLKSYKLGRVDVVSDINPNTIKGEQLVGFFSDIAYTYENFAYTLKKRNFQFKSMMDLSDYSMLSWQGATLHLGDEYAKMAENNPLYSEHHDQSLQVKMLYLERVDVVQMDKQIFDYYRTEVGQKGEIDTSGEVDRFGFFGESPNGYLFRNNTMRDEFNQRLKELKASGDYQRILERYRYQPASN